jgi:flavodoxin
MKTIMIYTSTHHRNTEQIARAIGEVLKADLHSLERENISSINLEGYDLIGLGAGVRAQKPDPKIMRAVDKLDLKDRKVFLFSTSAGNSVDEIRMLKDTVLQKQAHLMGEFMCPGFFDWAFMKWFGGYNKGHPDTTDLENARKFAQSLLK